MLKGLQKLIDASQPAPDGAGEDENHRRDAYPVRVILTLVIWASIIVILLRACAALLK